MANDLAQDLAALLNRYCQENGSNTSDYLLAEYLLACLATWNTIVVKRDQWYGFLQGIPDAASAPLEAPERPSQSY